jgi:hypothetical protein
VLLREFGFRYMLKAAALMVLVALTAGGFLNVVM